MKDKSTPFTTSFTVDQSPQAAFDAIRDVKSWWSRTIDGQTSAVGDDFAYRYKELHSSKQRLTELVPQQRVVWKVVEAELTFTKQRNEWVGTQLRFELTAKNGKTEVRFTHEGLTAQLECFDACSKAWTYYVNESLQRRITTGAGQPDDED